MKLENFRGIPLISTLIIALLASCYIQISYIPEIIPEYGEFLTKFGEDIKNLEILMLVISFIFQLFILIATIGMEVILVYMAVYFFYKKRLQLREFTQPVMLATLCVLFINIIMSLLLLPTTQDIDTLKNITMFSPVNFLVKPVIICYFLYEKKILPAKLVEWIKLSLVYVLVTCIPGVIMLIIY
ncbi:hypothetical protein CU633_21140 [Bacillus sp. V3-13]|uniref:hypothetical protein n=1 Tax=Bacillus sp. V3-13 TaxID=2053728 RepID=UPI000C781E27|nr:hypothetical protein [Bacillus sp. V3-13]PLR75426.1 hypothetical protein CU633_21140 [Bacillus sp. V3-13]